jgi:hypothetical protein
LFIVNYSFTKKKLTVEQLIAITSTQKPLLSKDYSGAGGIHHAELSAQPFHTFVYSSQKLSGFSLKPCLQQFTHKPIKHNNFYEKKF